MLISCDLCDKPFFDGELLTIRNVNGTELLYHHECFIAWTDEQRNVAKTFGAGFDQDPAVAVEFYERQFFNHQINNLDS